MANGTTCPAAHAAAIFFDLATVVGLFVLGRLRLVAGGPAARGRGPAGVVLAFAWLAYPYTAFALQSNSNDSLVAALLIWGFVLLQLAGGAGRVHRGRRRMAKFAPLALVPLYVVGERGLLDRMEGWRPRWAALRPVIIATVAFAVAAAILLAHPAIDPGLATFWERTAESQLNRESPFSVWGQAEGVDWLQTAVLALRRRCWLWSWRSSLADATSGGLLRSRGQYCSPFSSRWTTGSTSTSHGSWGWRVRP